MSGVLTSLLENIRQEYVELMLNNGEVEPYLTAERLCYEKLFLNTDRLAEVIEQDPTLLAARAGDLVMNEEESKDPSVGVIICSNIIAAALEGLLAVAVEREWLSVDEQGAILVDEEELRQGCQYPAVDYSQSEKALENVSKGGKSQLSEIFSAAESAFIESLKQYSSGKDAYQQALDVSSNHSVFAPEDIAPLIAENPLLLGLRPEDLIDDELFEGDPPAGLIVSAHLTRMMLHQMLELGVEHGELVLDSSGHIVVPDEPSDPPKIH